MNSTNALQADPRAIAQALLDSAQPVHQLQIDPADEAEVLVNLELAAIMHHQLEEVQLSGNEIDFAPVFSASAPERP